MQSTMSHWAEACRAQGGTVVLPHFPWPNGDPAALIALGLADAVEMCRQVPFDHDEYYRYLNAGYRLPLVGGTDKMATDTPVGIYRTYVQLPEDVPFTYDAWRHQMSAGRTFMSSGPLIGLSVEGHAIGDTVHLRGNGGTVHVEAWAEGSLPIYNLQIVQEGRVVAETVAREGTRRLELSERLRADGHTWFAARTGGPTYYDAVLPGWLAAAALRPHVAGVCLDGRRLAHVERRHRPIHAHHDRRQLELRPAAARAASRRMIQSPTTTASPITRPTWSARS